MLEHQDEVRGLGEEGECVYMYIHVPVQIECYFALLPELTECDTAGVGQAAGISRRLRARRPTSAANSFL